MFNTLVTQPACEEIATLPTADNLSSAIKSLANNKAPGKSGVLPKMVKYGGQAFFDGLLSLVHKVWKVSCVPQDWRDAELVPVPKKGDLSWCDT